MTARRVQREVKIRKLTVCGEAEVVWSLYQCATGRG